MPTVLTPRLVATPGTPPTHNFGICETFSYIPIEGAGRPLYARASYITNFSDMSIHLSAGELSIGAVTIKDNNTGLNCDVVSDPDNNLNALRVITQDLESIYDDITIGDKSGLNYATIDGPLSSLNVKVTNLSVLESNTQNQIVVLSSFQIDFNNEIDETQILLVSLSGLQENRQNQIITLLHQLTANTDELEINTDGVETLLNSLTALNQKEFNETQTLLDSLTSLNQKEFNETQTLLNSLTALNQKEFNETQTLLDSLTSLNQKEFNETQTLLDSLTSLNQKEFNETQTLLDSLTSIQEDKQNQVITLLHQLTANTDELEINTDGVETLLNSLTSIQEDKQNQIITLLDILTAKDYAIELNAENFNLPIDSANISFNTLTIETLLSELTSKDYSTSLKQDYIVTLLDSLTSLTLVEFDETQTLLDSLTSLNQKEFNETQTLLDSLTSLNQKEFNETQTLLDSLTSLNQKEFNETQTLLNSLTSIQEDKQNQIITLLHQLTANTDELEINLDNLEINTDNVENLLSATNSFLNVLTAIDYATTSKQNDIITLLHQLTANTDELEINTDGVETLLDSLTALTLVGFDETQTLLVSLTSLNQREFDETQILLDSLAAKDFATATNQTLLLTSNKEFYDANLTYLVSVTATSSQILEKNNTTNNLLTTLTSVNFSTTTNQEKIITLLDTLTAKSEELKFNTDTIEELLTSSNTFLEILTSKDFASTIKQDEQITLLARLTSVIVANDVQIHTTQILPISGSITVINPVTSVEVSNSISLKDINNNNVSVTPATSSLNVNVTNPVVAIVDPTAGFQVSFAPTTNFDAFGRFKVSTPLTLFDSSHRYRDNNLWSSLTAFGAFIHFNPDQGLVEMSVNNLSGSSVVRETTKVFSYQPGKSLQVMNTFVMAPSTENLRQRVGYYGEDNGIYFQLDGGTLSFVKRSLINGSPSSETIIPQISWNGDKLDGSGPSGLTLDITKAQIQWMDIEWLGVGTVRIGFIINGQFIICHSFHHANQLASTYITTASLPLRYEITNKDTTNDHHTMKQICSTVISEGGYELRGLQQAVSIPISTPRTFTEAGTYYPIISVRLKTSPDRLDAIVILTALSILGKGNGINYNWQVKANGVTTGGSWIDAGIDSSVEYNITGTSFNGGRILASGFLNSSNQGSPNLDIIKEALFKFQLERNNLTKTPFELTLVVCTDTANGSGVFASMDWEEISR